MCSGIEAATVAWHPLGWEPAWFAEIDPFASAVLKHHWPAVPNLGDFTKIGAEHEPIDLLVGGTPCQDFSVAGLRAGLDGARGNLTLEFFALSRRLRPRWLVWENVPGVLSIDGGRAFGAILRLVGECGYGFAYRVLDAQYAGVPQRRRRVFLVGYLGDWRPAAAVLFERHSLSGHPAPRREAGQGVASGVAPSLEASGRGVERAGESRGQDPVIPVAYTVNSSQQRLDGTVETFVPVTGHTLTGESGRLHIEKDYVPIAVRTAQTSSNGWGEEGQAYTLDEAQGQAVLAPTIGANGDSHSGFRDEKGLVAFDLAQVTSKVNRSRVEPGKPSPSLAKDSQLHVAHALKADWHDASEDGTGRGIPLVAGTLGGGTLPRGYNNSPDLNSFIPMPMAVRRLTPRECERLQGFPDDYTLAPYRGKPAADGPRYRAIGNSMAVPVMAWIGQRIEAVERLRDATGEAG